MLQLKIVVILDYLDIMQKEQPKKGLVAFCFTNAPPAIAPHGAKKTLFGTNPICFACPTGTKVPFVLDTSISMINRGKIRRAAKLGEKNSFRCSARQKWETNNRSKKSFRRFTTSYCRI